MFEVGPTFWLTLIEFTFAYLICVISPGPDFALVVRNSVMYSRRTGMFTALGTSLGLIFHATYTLIGIAILIQQSEWGFTIIRILGAGYLGYLGLSSFFKKPKAFESMAHIDDNVKKVDAADDLTPFQAVRVGFVTDALNPFCMVFFISIFALVLDVNATLPVKVFFGAEIFVLALIWFLGVAWFFSNKHIREQLARTGMWFGRITGSVLIYYGLRLALTL
jgi:RhtB (resistance to homoserine/threonine) family protein